MVPKSGWSRVKQPAMAATSTYSQFVLRGRCPGLRGWAGECDWSGAEWKVSAKWKVSAPRISVTLCQARWGLEGSGVHSRKQLKVLSTVAEGLGVMEEDLIFTEQLLEARPQALYTLLYWISTQGCILSTCLCNFYAEYIIRNAGLDEAQAGIKIPRRNISNLSYADDTTLMAESEEELRSLLTKVKEESEKVGLKLNIQKMKIMVSGPITSWKIDGERVADFIFLGLQNHCRWWL